MQVTTSNERYYNSKCSYALQKTTLQAREVQEAVVCNRYLELALQLLALQL
jgi:hypothetical protein